MNGTNGTISRPTETKAGLLIDLRGGQYALEVDTRLFTKPICSPGRLRIECRTARSRVLLAVAALVLEKNKTAGNLGFVDCSALRTDMQLLSQIYAQEQIKKPEDLSQVLRVGYSSATRGFGTRGIDFFLNGTPKSWPSGVPEDIAKLFQVQTRGGNLAVRLNQNRIQITLDEISVLGCDDLENRLKESQTAIPTQTSRHHSFTFDATIERFCMWHLGTANHAVTFGGRDSEIAALKGWWEKPDTPSYLFLTSPGGYGKSSLLVHWINKLRTCQNTEVVFFPISIRFGTNRPEQLFQHLVERLSKIHGKTVDVNSLLPEGLRDTALQFLSASPPPGSRLLIVIDGLDEVTEWSRVQALFSLKTPPEARIVVTARTQDKNSEKEWLAQLGWSARLTAKVIRLGALDQHSIRHILEHSHLDFGALADKEMVVAQLVRVSGGIPFLLGLYIELIREFALANSGRQPDTEYVLDSLTGVPPGLDGLVNRWRREQRSLLKEDFDEDVIGLITSLLASAKGPMSLGDLQRLATSFGIKGVHKLRRALSALSIFVAQDDTQACYIFRHPVLRDYFKKHLTDYDLIRYQESFVAAGKALIASLQSGNTPHEFVSPYFVRHLGAHMQEFGSPVETMRDLTQAVWRDAWLHIDRRSWGFLNDVRRVLEAARRNSSSKDSLGIEIRCLLIEATYASIKTHLYPELLSALLQEDVWAPAEAQAQLSAVRSAPEQVHLLLTYVASVRAKHPEEPVLPFLLEARKLAIQSDVASEELLVQIAVAHAESEDPKGALATARLIKQPGLRAEAFARISACVRDDKQAEVLLRRANQIVAKPVPLMPVYRDYALMTIADQWLRRGNLKGAASSVRKMSSLSEHRELLKSLLRLKQKGRMSPIIRSSDFDERFKVARQYLISASFEETVLRDCSELHFDALQHEDTDLFDLFQSLLDSKSAGGLDPREAARFRRLKARIHTIRDGGAGKQKDHLLRQIRREADLLSDPLEAITMLAFVAAKLPPGQEKERVIEESLSKLPPRQVGFWVSSVGSEAAYNTVGRRSRGLLRIAKAVTNHQQRRSLLLDSLQECNWVPDVVSQFRTLGALAQTTVRHGTPRTTAKIVSLISPRPFRLEEISKLLASTPPGLERNHWLETAITDAEKDLFHYPYLVIPAIERILERPGLETHADRLFRFIKQIPDDSTGIWLQDRMLLKLLGAVTKPIQRELLLKRVLGLCDGRFQRGPLSLGIHIYSALALALYPFPEEATVNFNGFINKLHYFSSLVRLAKCASNKKLRMRAIGYALGEFSQLPDVCSHEDSQAVVYLACQLAVAGQRDEALQLIEMSLPNLACDFDNFEEMLKWTTPSERIQLLCSVFSELANAKQTSGMPMFKPAEQVIKRLSSKTQTVTNAPAKKKHQYDDKHPAVALAVIAQGLCSADRKVLLNAALEVCMFEEARADRDGFDGMFYSRRESLEFPKYLFTPLSRVMAICAQSGMIKEVDRATRTFRTIEEYIGAFFALQHALAPSRLRDMVCQPLLRCPCISGTWATCAEDMLLYSDLLHLDSDVVTVRSKAFALAAAGDDGVALLHLASMFEERKCDPCRISSLLAKAMGASRFEGPIPLKSRSANSAAMLSRKFVSEVLRIAAQHGREALLNHISDLAEALHAVGGVETVETTATSIADISNWWPFGRMTSKPMPAIESVA